MKELPEINVIDSFYKSELKEKGSRFIGLAFPVQNENDIFENFEKTKKEYYDASHHCYAYKLIQSFKYSDSGEPSGTAGIRILNAIEHFNLVNILLVVVRYFGGTKLGAGGLGKAYYEASYNVLEKAVIMKKNLFQKIYIGIDYQLAQKVYNLIDKSENKIIKVNYDEQTNFECLVKPEQLLRFTNEIRDFSNGKAEIKLSEKIYY